MPYNWQSFQVKDHFVDLIKIKADIYIRFILPDVGYSDLFVLNCPSAVDSYPIFGSFCPKCPGTLLFMPDIPDLLSETP